MSLILSLETFRGRSMNALRKIATATALFATAGASLAQGPKPLELIAFGGGGNWPVWAAQEKGLFAKNGIAVTLSLIVVICTVLYFRRVQTAFLKEGILLGCLWLAISVAIVNHAPVVTPIASQVRSRHEGSPPATAS